jgi:hypothetical protein
MELKLMQLVAPFSPRIHAFHLDAYAIVELWVNGKQLA